MSEWEAGDRAMCLNARGANLVFGRVYRVAEIVPGEWQLGLLLDGVEVPRPFRGYHASRFHRIPKGQTYHQSGGRVL